MTKPDPTYLVLGIIAALGMACHSRPGLAEASWQPDKHVEIVVPAAAGGGTDRTARLMQKIFYDQKSLPTASVVVNKPGGGGSIGYQYVIQHRGDGAYLAITQPALLTDAIIGTSSINFKSVTPLAQLGTEYVAYAVKQDSPLKTVDDLLGKLKVDPASVVFGISNAVAAPGHIAIGLVMKSAGVDLKKMKIVVFSSGGDSMTSLLGGHVDVITTTVANLVSPLSSNMVRVLAVAAPRRLGGPFANVPTWKEKGVDAVVGNWRGVVGPPGLTANQIAFWDEKLAKLAHSAAWLQACERDSMEPQYLDSADSKKFLAEQDTEIKRVLIDLGLAKAN